MGDTDRALEEAMDCLKVAFSLVGNFLARQELGFSTCDYDIRYLINLRNTLDYHARELGKLLVAEGITE